MFIPRGNRNNGKTKGTHGLPGVERPKSTVLEREKSTEGKGPRKTRSLVEEPEMNMHR